MSLHLVNICRQTLHRQIQRNFKPSRADLRGWTDGGSARVILETRSIKRLYGRSDENLVSPPAGVVAAWLRLIYREISPVLPGGIQRGRRPDMRARAPNNLICRDRAERNFMLSRACGAQPPPAPPQPPSASDQTSFRRFCPSVFPFPLPSLLPFRPRSQIWKQARFQVVVETGQNFVDWTADLHAIGLV